MTLSVVRVLGGPQWSYFAPRVSHLWQTIISLLLYWKKTPETIFNEKLCLSISLLLCNSRQGLHSRKVGNQQQLVRRYREPQEGISFNKVSWLFQMIIISLHFTTFLLRSLTVRADLLSLITTVVNTMWFLNLFLAYKLTEKNKSNQAKKIQTNKFYTEAKISINTRRRKEYSEHTVHGLLIISSQSIFADTTIPLVPPAKKNSVTMICPDWPTWPMPCAYKIPLRLRCSFLLLVLNLNILKILAEGKEGLGYSTVNLANLLAYTAQTVLSHASLISKQRDHSLS